MEDSGKGSLAVGVLERTVASVLPRGLVVVEADALLARDAWADAPEASSGSGLLSTIMW